MAYGPEWVQGQEGVLARSSRPGYPGEDVDQAAVEAWLGRAKEMGIKSVICLLDEMQLSYYRRVPGGLLEFCRRHGFEVLHVPITDPARDPQGRPQLEAQLEGIYEAFCRLPKPVLVHCSAGVDRTGKVVQYICDRLREAGQHGG